MDADSLDIRFGEQETVLAQSDGRIRSSMPTLFTCGENKEDNDFYKGCALCVSPLGGLLYASSGPGAIKPCVGLACLGAARGLSEICQIDGAFCLEDWTPIVGVRELVPGSLYWLGLDGHISPTAAPVGISQAIGRAASRHTLVIDIQGQILL